MGVLDTVLTGDAREIGGGGSINREKIGPSQAQNSASWGNGMTIGIAAIPGSVMLG